MSQSLRGSPPRDVPCIMISTNQHNVAEISCCFFVCCCFFIVFVKQKYFSWQVLWK